MKLKLLGLAAAAALGFTSTQASAAAVLITDWEWTVNVEWTGATFTGGTGSQTSNASELSWGQTDGTFEVPGGNRSALIIDPAETTGSVETGGDTVFTSIITHFNNAISSSFATLQSATLFTTLSLVPTAPVGYEDEFAAAFPLPLGTSFTTRFFETPNSTPCLIKDSGAPCSDIFVVLLPDLSFDFEFLGVAYTTNIVPAGFGPLGDSVCEAFEPPVVLNGSPCVGFTTFENAATPVQFGFNITGTVIPVPEPATLALLGLGLLGLGAFSRRRKEG